LRRIGNDVGMHKSRQLTNVRPVGAVLLFAELFAS